MQDNNIIQKAIDTLKRLHKENAELKAENERLKEENEELCDRMATVTYRATGGRLSYSNYTLNAIEQAFYDQLDILSDQKIEPYKQVLQEIKAIAELPKPFKDFSEIKTATEVEYDYAAICNELELRLHKVLELITKAESEG